MKDVIIVGAGPIGCFLAKELATKGFKVTVLEEHPTIGNPMCCAGILGATAMKKTGLNPSKCSLNTLSGGIFCSPDGESVKITREKTEAYVIDRSKFDRELAKEALKSGAEIRLNSRCKTITRSDDQISIKIKNLRRKKKLKGRMIVGADGTNSMVARKFDLMKNYSPTVGIQAEVAGNAEDHDAKVFLGNQISGDFFAWIVPSGEVYRVGMGESRGNLHNRILNFMKNNPFLPNDSKDRIVSLTSGLIPSADSRKIYDERVLLVGDAAGHVKPLTGGGIYLGISGAKIASKIMESALDKKPSKELLKSYDKSIKKEFDREFELGEKARQILKNMSDDDLSDLIELLKNEKIKKFILENADFDHHSSLFSQLIKEGPSLIKSVGARKSLKFINWFVNSSPIDRE